MGMRRRNEAAWPSVCRKCRRSGRDPIRTQRSDPTNRRMTLEEQGWRREGEGKEEEKGRR